MIPAFSPNAVTGLFRSYSAFWAFRDLGSGAASLVADVGTNAAITRATVATCFSSSGALLSVASGTARFDYDPSTLAPLGLLVEEARTNSLRNNTMQGAAAGTPGTLPTNWSGAQNGGTGLAHAVIGTGTESGISYIDVRVSGTPSAGGNYQFALDTTTGISATTGQTWAFSSYFKVVGGGLTNTALNTGVDEWTSAPAFIKATSVLNSIAATGAGLATQRYGGTATLSGGGTTAAVRPYITLTATGGQAIDITLRIGMPQIELGASVTSVIATTSAAATRNADNVVISTISPWFNATEGTIVVEGDVNATTADGTARTPWGFSDGTFNESIYVTRNASAASLTSNVIDGGVNQASLNAGNVTANTAFKSAVAYKVNDFAHSLNGAAVVTDTSGTLPTVTGLTIGNANWSGAGNWLNGHIRRLSYYNTRLTNAQLQALSTL